MKELLILLIIFIVGSIFLYCPNLELFEDLNYQSPEAGIKISKKVKSRGVFALKNYKKGDIIEVCPCIIDDTQSFEGVIQDYLFTYDDKTSLVAFGYCSMYNHSDDCNATWKIISKEKMKVHATKDINKGQEIFVSYGDAYWKSRKSDIKH